MEVRRTAAVKLTVSNEQRDALHRTADQFLGCANRTSEFCWDDSSFANCRTNKREVRDALYTELREDTELPAQLVQAAIRRGVEAIKGVAERWKHGKRVSRPTFTSQTMDYDARSATISRTKASLATVDGRLELPFVLPAASPTPYERYILPVEYDFRESTLRYDEVTDEFYLNISTRRSDSDQSEGSAATEHQTVLGIDLGVTNLAVASTGRFWQGDDYDHRIREFEKHRAAMHQRGTQAAHNALLRLGRREEAWRKQYVHTVANEIVSEAVERDCDAIVFEQLDGIRERLPHATWHHVWAFRRLYEYVEYKAAEWGIEVTQVPAHHTSQRCSRMDCGFTHENNRAGKHFHCGDCGYEVNADYNAAKNIGLRYARKRRRTLRSSPTSGSGDARVDVRVNGGTVTGGSHRQLVGD